MAKPIDSDLSRMKKYFLKKVFRKSWIPILRRFRNRKSKAPSGSTPALFSDPLKRKGDTRGEVNL